MARRGIQQKTKNSKFAKRFPSPDVPDLNSKAHETKRDLNVCGDDSTPNVDSTNPCCSGSDFSTDNHTIDKKARENEQPDDLNRSNFGNDASLARELRHVLTHLHNASALIMMNLKNLCMYPWVSVRRIETHRPLFLSIKSHFLTFFDNLKQKFAQLYPIIRKWSILFCNVVLLLFMSWLDCAVRGINSLLRIGTASFFSLLWFSVFSLISMVGIAKFLIILVVSLLVAAFVSFILGVIIFSISGIFFLWMYGSFWLTMFVIVLGVSAFGLNHEHVSLLITSLYSLYCAWGYVGWFGVISAMNLSFFSSEILFFFLRTVVRPSPGEEGYSEDASSSQTRTHFPSDCCPGVPSTSGDEVELTAEEEILRLLRCHDHYEVLGVPRYVDVDTSFLKREYRKKVILVHPDKNMGNEKAADAFKALQNAYEVLMDTFKRKAYDDKLRNEELMNYFRKFHPESEKRDYVESKRIACDKCKKFHLWKCTQKPKSRARFCQDCNGFHQTKDGDGWVEQLSQPLLFGFIKKVNAPSAYVCADGKIYDVTEWFVCQGIRCPANTHKVSFHVNTSVIEHGGKRKKGMNDEDIFEWFQNAAMSDAATSNVPAPASAADKSPPSNSSKRKKKGKKQW